MDKTTFEQLYRDMLPGLYRLAQSILHQSADAQDAVQQAAVKAWLARDGIRSGNERAYFARIVINNAAIFNVSVCGYSPWQTFRTKGICPRIRILQMQ